MTSLQFNALQTVVVLLAHVEELRDAIIGQAFMYTDIHISCMQLQVLSEMHAAAKVLLLPCDVSCGCCVGAG